LQPRVIFLTIAQMYFYSSKLQDILPYTSLFRQGQGGSMS